MAVESGTYDQATVARRQAIAEAMLADSRKAKPIRHWAEGLAQVADAGVAGYAFNKAEQDAKGLKAQDTAALASLLGGTPATPAASPVSPAPSAVPTTPPGGAPMAAAPMGNAVASAMSPAAASPPVNVPRPEVTPSAKVWGDKEAEDAGLYEKPAAQPGVKVATAMGGNAPMPAPAPVAAPSAAPAPSGGLLASATPQQRATIAAGLQAHEGSPARNIAMAMITKLAGNETPKYEFKTAGDNLYRTNSATGTAEPIKDVGRGVKPMTADQRKEWNVPEGMSAGIDDNGKPVFSPPGTNINLNTQTDALKKVQATAIEDMQTANSAAREATKRSGIWDSMEQAAKGFKPGATADIKLSAGRYLKDLGITAGDGVPDAEVFKQMQQQIAIHAQPKGQGAVSNAERELFAKAIPNITMSPEALQRSITISKSLDGFDRKVASIYRENTRKNGGVPNAVEINEEIDKLGSPLTPADSSFLNKAASSSSAENPAKAVAAPTTAGWQDLGGGIRIREKK